MLRLTAATLLVVAAVSVAAASQQPSAPAAQPARKDAQKDQAPPKTLTLSGCVEKAAAGNQYTLLDAENGKYAVTGNGIEKFAGRRVQVAGTPGSDRLIVKGGLYPTPNVAAQAGAIDPAKAAIAAMPGGPSTGVGDVSLPTLKIKSIRTLDGGCK